MEETPIRLDPSIGPVIAALILGRSYSNLGRTELLGLLRDEEPAAPPERQEFTGGSEHDLSHNRP